MIEEVSEQRMQRSSAVLRAAFILILRRERQGAEIIAMKSADDHIHAGLASQGEGIVGENRCIGLHL